MSVQAFTIVDKHGVSRHDRITGTFAGTCISVQEWSRRDDKNERKAVIELDSFVIQEVDRARTEHDHGEQPRLDGSS